MEKQTKQQDFSLKVMNFGKKQRERGRTQAISEFKEKIEEIFDFLEDNGYLTFWIRNGRDGKDELKAEIDKTAQEIKA